MLVNLPAPISNSSEDMLHKLDITDLVKYPEVTRQE